jgi:hypothetical protein
LSELLQTIQKPVRNNHSKTGSEFEWLDGSEWAFDYLTIQIPELKASGD